MGSTTHDNTYIISSFFFFFYTVVMFEVFLGKENYT